jgi:DNA-binding MarR family transcriptional regulator
MEDVAATHWLDPEQQRSWRALVMGTTLLMDRLDADLRAGHHISLTEYEILVRLSEQPDRRMRMAHLADAMCHSRSRVTHTVRRMEQSGWLLRSGSPEDGRGVLAIMTDAGFALLEAAAHDHVTGVRSNVVDLASDDDFAALGRVMNAVADHLVARHPAAEIR